MLLKLSQYLLSFLLLFCGTDNQTDQSFRRQNIADLGCHGPAHLGTGRGVHDLYDLVQGGHVQFLAEVENLVHFGRLFDPRMVVLGVVYSCESGTVRTARFWTFRRSTCSLRLPASAAAN